jgi:hypothetical protein
VISSRSTQRCGGEVQPGGFGQSWLGSGLWSIDSVVSCRVWGNWPGGELWNQWCEGIDCTLWIYCGDEEMMAKKINVNLYRNKMLKIILHCFCLFLFTYIYTHYDWIFSSGIFIFNKIFLKKEEEEEEEDSIIFKHQNDVYSYMNINHDLNFPDINLLQLLHFPISVKQDLLVDR